MTFDLPDPLPIDDYVVLVEIDWSATLPSSERKYVFQTYSQTNQIEVALQPINKNFDYLAEILKGCAKKRTVRKTYAEKGHPEVYRQMSITDSQAEYGYVFY